MLAHAATSLQFGSRQSTNPSLSLSIPSWHASVPTSVGVSQDTSKHAALPLDEDRSLKDVGASSLVSDALIHSSTSSSDGL